MVKHSFILAAKEDKPPFYMLTRYIIGTLLIIAAAVVSNIPIFLAFRGEPRLLENLDFAAIGIPQGIGLVLVLFPFPMIIFALFYIIQNFHQRIVISLITSANNINWKRFFSGMLIWTLMAILFEFVAYFMQPNNYTWNLELDKFLPIFFVAIVFIPLQSLCEELLFRGYYLQGISFMTKRAWIGALVSSILFGLLHLTNPEVKNFGNELLFYYISVGLFFAVITLLEESSELAMGMHTANNLFATLLITYPNAAFQTPALILTKTTHLGITMILWSMMAILTFLICKWLYKWDNFKKLFEPISI